jgi:hypothetical protein
MSTAPLRSRLGDSQLSLTAVPSNRAARVSKRPVAVFEAAHVNRFLTVAAR